MQVHTYLIAFNLCNKVLLVMQECKLQSMQVLNYLIAFNLCTTGATLLSSLRCCHLTDCNDTSRSTLSKYGLKKCDKLSTIFWMAVTVLISSKLGLKNKQKLINNNNKNNNISNSGSILIIAVTIKVKTIQYYVNKDRC